MKNAPDTNGISNKKYWMKRRRYGWGGTPVTWQGWLFVALQLGIIVVAIRMLPKEPDYPSASQLVGSLLITAFVAVSIVLVSAYAAPPPHWRWGKKDTDNSDEDF